MIDQTFETSHNWFETALTGIGWALLAAALGLFTLTETYRAWVPVGLVLLAVFAVLFVAQAAFVSPAMRQALRSEMVLPVVLFLASAAFAATISYERPLAILQFGRVAAGAGLFYAVAASQAGLRRWLAAAFVLAAAALALYWPLEHDFSTDPAKIASLQRFGLWIQANLPRVKLEALTGDRIHSNVAAGVLLVAFPFTLALAWELWRGWGRSPGKRSLWLGFLGLVPAGMVLACLALTSSRGAFIGLFAMVGLAGLVWVQRLWFRSRFRRLVFWIAVILVGLVASGFIFSELLQRLALARLSGELQNPTESFLHRIALLPYGVQLIRDYFFTGSGLRSFHMVYGVYSVMLDMVVDDHIHNTFLEIWIEQGLLGIVAVGLAGLWLVSRFWETLDEPQPNPWVWAALAALFAAGVQGLVDVVFYVERTLPLLGLIAGFATRVPLPIGAVVASQPQPPVAAPSNPEKFLKRLPLSSLALLAVLLIWSYSQRARVLAMAYANLGAVRQTQIEMAAIPPTGQGAAPMDQIRQELDLTPAEAAFHQALAFDPQNLTARQRLAQIYMSRGEYDAALAQIQGAWDAGHRDSITRMLYGDACIAEGDPQSAADAVRGVAWGVPRLLGQAWYRYWIFNDFRRAADAWSAVLLIDPQNQSAAYWREQANQKLAP